MVRKAYLKPPPKLPPPTQSRVALSAQPTARMTKCGATVMQSVAQVNIEAREMFADALERAIKSEQTASDTVDVTWAEHPYYDDLDIVTVGDVDEENEYEDKPVLEGETVCDAEESWAEHPYYDDLNTSVTVHDVDEMQESEGNVHHEEEDVTEDDENQELDNNAHNVEEESYDVPWEDHPGYDTPDEEAECRAESDLDDAACEDSEEEEVAWEDSPYY